MIRTLVWGFHHRNFGDAVERLRRAGEIDLVAWIGKDRRCTHDIRDLLALRIDRTGRFSGIPAAVRERLDAKWPDILEIFLRSDAALGLSYHAQLNIFNVYCEYAYQLLKRTDPELILFVYVPHLGPELIFHEVARALGIPVLMVYPHLVANRFFYLYDIDDYGAFRTAREADPGETFRIPRTFQKECFYVPKKYPGPRGEWSIAGELVTRHVRRALRGRNVELTLPGLIRATAAQREYRRLLSEHAAADVDLARPFVYFPLHLQPELTTSPLGGVYTDQLTAIERLLALLPADWHVYVKENPRQDSFRRGRLFFERLARLPGVTLVSPACDTYTLMRRCRFVATITGTAGWEAISGGKPALVFGKAWYRSLPGVVEFREGLTLEDVVNRPFEHGDLEAAYNALMRKTRVGIVEPNYRGQVPGYSDERNLEHILAFLQDELEHFRTHGVPSLKHRRTAA